MSTYRSHAQTRVLLPVLALFGAGCVADGEGVGGEVRASDEVVASSAEALQHAEARHIYIEEHGDTCDLSASGAHPCAFFQTQNVPLNPTTDTWFDFSLQIGARVTLQMTYTTGNTGPGDDISILLWREEPGGAYLNYRGPRSSGSGFILFDIVEDRGPGRWLVQVVRAHTTVSHLNISMDCSAFANGVGRCSQFLQPYEACAGWDRCDSGLACMKTIFTRAQPWEYGTCRKPARILLPPYFPLSGN